MQLYWDLINKKSVDFLEFGTAALLSMVILTGQPRATLAKDTNEPNAKILVVQGQADKRNLIDFKVIPKEGLMVNEEGPWSLSLQGSALKWKESQLKRDKYDGTIPGFRSQLEVLPKESVEVDYSMTVFVCTKDKTRCYRDVFKGRFQVNP